jgi:ABC-type sugar transport system ATPase subunit
MLHPLEVDTRDRTDLLTVRGVSRSYGSIQALSDVSLDVRPGEIHGLCGHNGAGKSTLLKILAGATQADAGTVEIDGIQLNLRSPRDAQAVGIALVDQELSIVSDLSVADNVLLGRPDTPFLRRPGASDRAVRKVLDLAGLSHVSGRQYADSLTIGEQQLLQIARALGREARLLILDEPTASLTENETELVFRAVRALAASGRSVIFVSHRLDEVRSLCDRVTVLRDGRKVTTQDVGSVTSRDLVELILGDVETAVRPARRREATGEGLSVRSLSVGDRVDRVEFDVAAGEIVAFAGQVGSGAAEVLRALAGLRADVDGTVTLCGKTVRLRSVERCVRQGLAYVTPDRKGEGLFLTRSTGENLMVTRLPRYSRVGFLRPKEIQRESGSLAQEIGVPSERLGDPVGMFSGGNQQKTLIGRCLKQQQTRVLLLDEPTRGVDVRGREDIHRLIFEAADAGAAVLVASSELDEVLDLADRVVTMRAGKQVGVYARTGLSRADLLSDMTHGDDHD